MFEIIRADAARFASKGVSFARLLTRNFGFQAVLVYRLGHWLHTCLRQPLGWLLAPLFPAYWLCSLFIRKAYDIHLSPSAEIGPGLIIWHFGGIRIGNCTIGSNCTIHHRVAIEPDIAGGDGPSIGNSVWIGPHARIKGSVTLGKGATLGAGATVAMDVAPYSLILGNPARVIRKNYDNSEIL